MLWGQQNILMGKGTCHQLNKPEFDPWTHPVEGKNYSLQAVLWLLHTCTHLSIYIHIYIYIKLPYNMLLLFINYCQRQEQASKPTNSSGDSFSVKSSTLNTGTLFTLKSQSTWSTPVHILHQTWPSIHWLWCNRYSIFTPLLSTADLAHGRHLKARIKTRGNEGIKGLAGKSPQSPVQEFGF